MFSSTHTFGLISKLLIGLCMFAMLTITTPFSVSAGEHGEIKAGTGEKSEAKDPETVINEISGVEGFIYGIAVGIGGFFLWLGGSLLDYAIEETVVGMGEVLRGGVGVAVDKLWVVVRDTFNILFIFGLIYIGFRTILKSDDAGTKRAVALLIVAALLINFSLFITKAVVDFSNLMAFQIHEVIITDDTNAGVGGGTGSGADASNQQLNEEGISYAFMNYFQLTTYAQSDVIKQAQEETSLLSGRLIFYGLLMMLIMLIAAFVFAAGAFILIARFVMLIIFMILSPAMFLGFIFPLFEQYQTKWWNGFLKNAFVAPAYLFMIYISLWVIAGLSNAGSFAQGFQSESYGEGYFIIFLNFFIIAGFLIASLIIAQQLGVYGASASVNVLNKAKDKTIGYAKRTAGGATFGMAARTGRAAIGTPAHALTQNDKFKNWAKNTWLGEKTFNATSSIADKSFDARKIGGIGKDLGIGEGRKGGVTSIIKERKKKREKFEDALGTVDKDSDQYKERVKYLKNNKKEYVNASNDVTEKQRAVREQEGMMQTARAELNEQTRPHRERIKELNREYEGASDERKKEITNEINAANASITTAEREFENETASLQTELQNAKQRLQTAETKLKEEGNLVEAEAEYQRLVDYRRRLNRQSNMLGRFFMDEGDGQRMVPTDEHGNEKTLIVDPLSYQVQQDAKESFKRTGEFGEKMRTRKKQKEQAEILKEVGEAEGVSLSGSDTSGGSGGGEEST